MKALPASQQPLIVRTSPEHQAAWESIQQLILAPVRVGENAFMARVQFLDDSELYGVQAPDLVAMAGEAYRQPFVVAVDQDAMLHPEFAVLVISTRQQRGRASALCRIRSRRSRTT